MNLHEFDNARKEKIVIDSWKIEIVFSVIRFLDVQV